MAVRKVIFIVLGSVLTFAGLLFIAGTSYLYGGLLMIIGIFNILIGILGNVMVRSGNKKIDEINTNAKRRDVLRSPTEQEEVY